VVPMPSSAAQIVSGDSTVLQIQSALRERRYYRGALDGLSGPETRSAIRAYQLDRDLPVTGQIDSTLLNELLR
jgi:peptidoglycan hydrolase-like protein with peptidoglycan-binding domain